MTIVQEFADEKKELDGDDTELKRLVDTDLASLKALAKRLDLPVTLVVR
jgi:hypothetical protein